MASEGLEGFNKNKKEKYNSLVLKAKKVSSDEEALCSDSHDEEYAMVEEKKGKEERRCFKCDDLNHFLSDCPRHSFNDQKALVRGCWSDSEEEDDSKKDEICLMTLNNNEVRLKVKLGPDEWIKDSGCSRHMTGNKDLFSTYEAIIRGYIVFGSNTKSKIIKKGQICDKKCKVLFNEIDSEILKDSIIIGRGIKKNSLHIMKLGNSPKYSLCLASIDDTSTLWHRILGHANMRLIQSLSFKELVRNLPKLKFKELTIRRRPRTDHTLLNSYEMAAEGPGDLPVPDLRTMPSLNGRGGPVTPIAIQETNFRLKNDMIQQVQNSCEFHGLPGDDANKHLEKFLHVTQSIKVNGVTDDALRLYLFPHSLTHHATAWRPEGCYDLIENMTAHHNDWDTLAQWSESSSSITSSSDMEITALKAEMAKINKNLMKVHQVNQPVKAVTPNCETCAGPHSSSDCPATVGNTQNVYVAGAYQVHEDEYRFIFGFENSPSSRTDAIKDTVHPTNNGSTEDVQPPVVQTESLILNSEPVVALIIEPVASPKLPEKLGDPDKFLIPCDFPRMAECLVMADLGASINLMPLSIWNKLSLPDLSPTCMTLELADRSISRPVGIAEDVFVKVGTFHFSTDFVVVDFDADPRVPVILRRSFLKTERALIDVFEGKLTLHVGKEAITFNLNQTSRYLANYNDMMANRIDVIDMACEVYSQKVLCFFDMITSGNPTTYYDPIVYTTSPTLTPFRNSDFLLEEVDAFLALEDDPTSPEVD
uniref:Reverse transcriptase domain-containing protein n=1 Tax=Tanacetum cinerariifolium TaxID=118510 RepID=A0A6L2KAL1_TANCI|nr:reverse transcriptase domain-containing protein [Tanacetum cinerariifolium]